MRITLKNGTEINTAPGTKVTTEKIVTQDVPKGRWHLCYRLPKSKTVHKVAVNSIESMGNHKRVKKSLNSNVAEAQGGENALEG